MQYKEITQTTIFNLSNLMANEINTQFLVDFLSLNESLNCASHLINKIDEEDGAALLLGNIFTIANFFREHIELIHEMITAIKDN